MQQLFMSRSNWILLQALGWGFLASYLVLANDWRVSLIWALAFPAISVSVALSFVGFKLFDRFPKLNDYLLYPERDGTRPIAASDDDWALKQAKYFSSAFPKRALLSSPAEDGLICVPVLFVGVGPLSAGIGGLVFGILHLGRFTYLECIGKTITYALVCYFILPHGLLTVALGHMITNSIAFVGTVIARRKLSEKLHSNPTVDADARNSGARGSP